MPTTTTPCTSCKGTGRKTEMYEEMPCELCRATGRIHNRVLDWEPLEGDYIVDQDGKLHFREEHTLVRCAVPGGWLVQRWFSGMDGGGAGVTFVPDPNHSWEP
jgi:hypothetical protein